MIFIFVYILSISTNVKTIFNCKKCDCALYLLCVRVVISAPADRSVVPQRLVPSQGHGQVVQAGVHLVALVVLVGQQLEPRVHPLLLLHEVLDGVLVHLQYLQQVVQAGNIRT